MQNSIHAHTAESPVFTIRWHDHSVAPVPMHYSLSRTKCALYALDTYFRESYADASACLGDGVDVVLERHCSVILKPECIASRKVNQALQYLRAAGFEPVHSAIVDLDRLLVRELWRYQVNSYTDDRLDYLNRWMALSPALLIVLRDCGPDRSKSASARVTDLKGNSDPARTDRASLRAALGQEIDLINYVHTTDDVADLVRDLGVLFEQPARRGIYQAMCDQRPSDLPERHIRELYGRAVAHDFSLRDSLSCLRQDPSVATNASLVGSIDRLLDEGGLDASARGDFLAETGHLLRGGSSLSEWDCLTIVAACTPPNVPGVTAIMPSVLQVSYLFPDPEGRP